MRVPQTRYNLFSAISIHTLEIYAPFYAIYYCISCGVCMTEYLNETETFLQRFGGDNGDGYTTT